MTHEAHRPATEQQATTVWFYPKRSDQRASAARRRPCRQATRADAEPIEDLIQQAIADQPPQLYRGGA